MSPHFFGNIYSLYYKQACQFAKYYVRDEGESEDIASEALLKVWRETKTEDIASVRPLLITILRNKSYDYLRHEQVKQTALDEISGSRKQELRETIHTWEQTIHCDLFSEEVNRILARTLTTLPRRTRKVFQMIRFDKLSYQEAAQQMGISVKGIDYHIVKAQRALRIALKDYL